MIQQLRKIPGHWVVALGIIFAGLLGGCQTAPKFPEVPSENIGTTFHVGDEVAITFVTPSGAVDAIPPFAGRIQDDGTITLQYINAVTAVGKTAGELQKEIHDLYVPKYFTELNVTVRGEGTFFYVDGEVAQRGEKPYPGQMTIVKAIAAAGGFTEFANPRKVRLTRGNHTQTINVNKAIKDPRYDVAVYPGDKIWVPRKFLW